jgi:DNA repair protein RecN (Recombination protein N)
LAEQGLSLDEDELVLRRVQHADGRTRAFVNDEPVGVRLLRDLGQALVEIHGQHDERALLEPAAHLALIDAFAAHDALLGDVGSAFRHWEAAEQALHDDREALARAAANIDFLRHSHEELTALAPQEGEEERLAAERTLRMAGEHITEQLMRAEGALFGEDGAEARIADALAALEKGDARAPGELASAIEALARGQAELAETRRELAEAQMRARSEPHLLEAAEERLFALRAAARKHGVAVDGLAELAEAIAEKLRSLESGEERHAELIGQRDEARSRYLETSRRLGAGRREAAARLDRAVMAELAPLRLEQASFETRFESVGEDRAGPRGLDRAQFMIAANQGTPPGPLARAASGGELSRVMLAIKVALAGRGGAPTLIFDEIDSGVGGAIADAVGERLQRLGGELQVVVVTHSPQVAARGHDHLLIEKTAGGTVSAVPRTLVLRLDTAARREEIARMLAGSKVTDEARAAAGRLIGGSAR